MKRHDDAALLILPVESRVREWDSKLLLGSVAAERGFRVLIGARPRVSFVLPRLPRGVFFAKSMRFTSDLMTGFIRGFGHRLVASDEESLVRFDHPDYYAWRYSERTFQALEHLFAWGQDDAEMLRRYPGRGNVAVHATGNPRIDLLRPGVREIFRAKADALLEAHGRFIMINTAFPFVNNYVPSLNLIQCGPGGAPEVGRTGKGMSLPFALGMVHHQQQIVTAFQALLPRLSEWFPDRNIVLRPHPSENHDFWRRAAAGLPNVRVVHEDSVIPWLMAADVLVHNGCTTAVEAAVLGTPSVAYRPVRSDAHDYRLPNSLGIEAYTADEVADAVDRALAGTAERHDVSNGLRNGAANGASSASPEQSLNGSCRQRSMLDRHLTITPDRLAADRIVDVLVEQGYLDRPPPAPGLARRCHAWIGTNVRTLVKQINLRRPGHRNSAEYFRHRFPPQSEADVNRQLETLGAILGRFGGVTAEPAGPDLFWIRR